MQVTLYLQFSKISEMRSLWLNYSNGVTTLESLVKELERYQAELERARLEKERLANALYQESLKKNNDWSWWIYLSIIATLLIICAYIFHRRTPKIPNISN
jgi:exonuclease VII small subunit